MPYITFLFFISRFKLFKNTANTAILKINFPIYFQFQFNIVIFWLWTFNTIQIHFRIHTESSVFKKTFMPLVGLTKSNISLSELKVLEFYIASFLYSYSFNSLFIETNSSWLIYESIQSRLLWHLFYLVLTTIFYHVSFSLNCWLVFFNSCSYYIII